MTRLTATHAASPPRRESRSRTARRFPSASPSPLRDVGGHRAPPGGRAIFLSETTTATPAVPATPSARRGMVQGFAMAAERKVSDEELVRLRRLSADGWTPADLAEAFGVTPQHVGRLLRGDQRPALADPDPDRELGDVSAACAAFLETAELDSVGDVLAATARALAAKLDACGASDAATAAQAAPRIAAQLVGVLGELRSRTPREPDEIDRIKARRAVRLARVAAEYAARNGDGAA
jgi:transcriptional regulator with XRE-family HTH domain